MTMAVHQTYFSAVLYKTITEKYTEKVHMGMIIFIYECSIQNATKI